MSYKSNTHKVLKNILGEIDIKAIGFILIFSAGLSWFGDSILSLFNTLKDFLCNADYQNDLSKIIFDLTFTILPILILLILIQVAKKYKLKDFEDATQINAIEFEKNKVLIIFLSKFYSVDEKLLASKNLEDFSRNNLEMPLKAINAHLPKLEKLQVICSKESKDDFNSFKTIVNNIFPNNKLTITSFGDDINFEQLDNVQEIIEEVYKKSFEITKNEKEIMIDVTGGQKIISIAGSYYALANERKFQYVSTTDKNVHQYNNKRVD